MRFDDVFDHLGDFGPYQRRQYFMLGMVIFSCGVQVMMTVFTLDLPNHRCALPGVQNDTYQIQGSAHDQLVQDYIPLMSRAQSIPAYSQCFLYGDWLISVYNGGNYSNEADTRHLVDKNDRSNSSQRNQVACSSWVYDTSDLSSTIATQMNFVCGDTLLKSHAIMTMMVGQVIGCLILGPLADIVGRKRSMMIALSLHLLASVLTTWAFNIYMLGALFLLNGLAMAAAYCASFTLAMELIGPKYRHVTGVSATMFWSAGMLWLCLLAYFLRDWQHLQLAASCPIILFSGYFCLVPESARWLIRKGRNSEAKSIIRKAAKINERKLPGFVFTDETTEEPTIKSESILSLLKCPTLLIRALIVFLNWLVCSLTYYGLGLNVGQLSGNIFLNFCLTAVFEIAATLVIVFAMGKFGRKSLYCSLLLLGSVSCILTLFPVLYGDESLKWTVSMLAMIGKFGVSGSFAIIWMFTSELFPTSFRAGVTGISSACARIGAVIASYIANLVSVLCARIGAVIASYIANLGAGGDVGIILPQLVFGTCGLVAASLALFLPETQEQQLPDSMEDAMKFSTNRRAEKENDKEDEAYVHLSSDQPALTSQSC
uniref:Major facilitator superfamily (MFS) profile domain-containing protein n=1 Tax=Biomphalaria glabrata TaxID=6526 RepID=A0A2C9JZ25_BIOGL